MFATVISLRVEKRDELFLFPHTQYVSGPVTSHARTHRRFESSEMQSHFSILIHACCCCCWEFGRLYLILNREQCPQIYENQPNDSRASSEIMLKILMEFYPDLCFLRFSVWHWASPWKYPTYEDCRPKHFFFKFDIKYFITENSY